MTAPKNGMDYPRMRIGKAERERIIAANAEREADEDAAYGREAEIAALNDIPLRPRDSTIVVTLTVKGDSSTAEVEVLKRLGGVLNGWFTEPAECIDGRGYPDGTLLLWGMVHRRVGVRPE